ncbi:MAG: hypothetical protein ACREEW_03585, partial [Caulobacteraceae bacterium]
HEFVRAERRRFAVFCLVGGWLFVFVLGRFAQTPSLGAAVDEAGGIWVLGVLLGLRAAVSAGDWLRTAAWIAALAVFPVWILVLAGFTSYGSEAAIVALAALAISARRYWRAIASIVLITVVGLTFFVNYFEHRKDIRHEAWGGASMENRADAVLGIFDTFHPIDFGSEQDMLALDKRLNQNLFVGLAAARIGEGEVGYLNGRSVWDGVLELIPRAYWPDKPVVAGSGHLVIDMTGLHLDENTSWGVGNVMEFYINFGMPGVIVGFLLLGWVLGALDIHAAAAERRGDFRRAIVLFLPAVGLIQPNGSVVEMTGAAAAAFVAAVGWQWLWDIWQVRGRARLGPASPGLRRSPPPSELSP